jgi:Transposase DDE domain
MPEVARIRRQTAEHVFGTLKSRMGATHFLMKRLPNVQTEMSLHVLAYNLKRAMQIFGVVPSLARGFVAGVLRDPVLPCYASWCQMQRTPRGKLLKLLRLSADLLHS